MPGRKKGLTRAPAHPPSDPSSAAGEAARGDSRCGCEEPFSGRARTGLGGKAWALTCMNFMATSRNPFCSNRLIISPTSPRWTPSGLMAMKVRSPFPAMALRAGARRERTRGLKVGDGHGGTALPRGTATECPPLHRHRISPPAPPQNVPPAPPNPARPRRTPLGLSACTPHAPGARGPTRPGLTYPELPPPLLSALLPPEEEAQEEAWTPQIPRPAQRRSRRAGGASGAGSPAPSGTGPGRDEVGVDRRAAASGPRDRGVGVGQAWPHLSSPPSRGLFTDAATVA